MAIKPVKLDKAVSAIQTIREQLEKLDKIYFELNEDSLKALHSNPDYNLIEDWSSNFIEFKYEVEDL